MIGHEGLIPADRLATEKTPIVQMVGTGAILVNRSLAKGINAYGKGFATAWLVPFRVMEAWQIEQRNETSGFEPGLGDDIGDDFKVGYRRFRTIAAVFGRRVFQIRIDDPERPRQCDAEAADNCGQHWLQLLAQRSLERLSRGELID